MNFTIRSGRLLVAATLLAIPSAGFAQDNAADAANAANATAVTNTADPALSDPMATDTMTNDGFDTAAPVDDTLANDLALANTVEPARDDDDDFPWGLLGLIGLAGLLGRKKNDGDIHVDARRDS